MNQDFDRRHRGGDQLGATRVKPIDTAVEEAAMGTIRFGSVKLAPTPVRAVPRQATHVWTQVEGGWR